MPRKLKEIEADEVSLVDKAANKTKFFILKRSKLMDEFIKILKQWFGEDVLTDEEIAKAKELPNHAFEPPSGALITRSTPVLKLVRVSPSKTLTCWFMGSPTAMSS